MTTYKIDLLGDRLDLDMKQGCSWGPFSVTLTNDNGTAVDLTGCTIRGSIRKTRLSTTQIVALTVTSDYDATGTFSFSLTPAQTLLIEAGESLNSAASQYVWDLEMLDSAERVTSIYYGTIRVLAEVTR